MVKAWDDGSDTIQSHHIERHPKGIAEAILRGDPSKVYPYIREIVQKSQGTFVSVNEEEIKEAQDMTSHWERVSICYSSAAAVAGLKKLAERKESDPDEPILVNLTGQDRTPAKLNGDERIYHRQNGSWVPEGEVGYSPIQ